MTLLYDRAQISGSARITPQGYFVADALVAQANNIQEYHRYELGLTDGDPQGIVRVFRPEAEVFAVDSLASASRLPITLDHPNSPATQGMVDASNWSQFAKGETGEEILRDGQFIRVPLRVTDEKAVASVLTDRQEFSLGYDCNVQMQPGTFDGAAYDAIATNLRYNHLAACRTARGGPQLRIVDERPVQQPPKGGTAMNIVIVDGMPVDASNPTSAETAIRNLVTARDTAVASLGDAMRTVGERDATIAAKDAEISNLRDAAAAAVVTPQALRDAAASYARTVDKAKALGATVTDAMDESAVIAAAVSHKLGDKAAKYTPEQNAAAFDALEAPAGSAPAPVRDGLALVIGHQPANIGDAVVEANKARDARFARFATAHTGRPAAAATA